MYFWEEPHEQAVYTIYYLYLLLFDKWTLGLTQPQKEITHPFMDQFRTLQHFLFFYLIQKAQQKTRNLPCQKMIFNLLQQPRGTKVSFPCPPHQI